MNYKYLRLRIQTFRREYFDNSNLWLKQSCSWIWKFSLDNLKFLYLGEINQIKYLSNTVRQQKEYIDFIQSKPSITNKNKVVDRRPDDLSTQEKVLKLVFITLLLPLSFLFYWIRRFIRIVMGKQFQLVVSKIYPTEDMVLDTKYEGKTHSIYLIPKDTRIFPRGLVVFKFKLKVNEDTAAPYLKIDPGAGFSSEYTIALPYDKNTDEQELLLELPPYCKLLQLEMSPVAINFLIKDVIVKETNFFNAAWYLKTKFNFGISDILHALFIRKLPGVQRTRADKSSYADWQHAYSCLYKDDKTAINNHIKTLNDPPLFSLFLNIDSEYPELLEQCIKSLQNQLYQKWELLVTTKQSPDAHVTFVLNNYERNDERVKIIIDKNTSPITYDFTNALQQAKGQYCIFLEYKDILTEHALYMFACNIQTNIDAKIIYSDYDHVNQYGTLSDPHFKPDWNYDFFLGKNYLQYLTCYKSDILTPALNTGITDPFTQISHLHLFLTDKLDTLEISHIPYVLLHHRKNITATENQHSNEQQHDMNAINTHLQCTNQLAAASPVKTGFWIRRTVPEPQPLISLIVLTRDRVALLSNCIQGLLEKTSYKNIEIIIVDNGSSEAATLSFMDAIAKDTRVRILKRDADFNFSELNNFAVEYANGDYIGLINNDISVIEPHWLDEMMSHIIRENVGVVGAKLLYENDTLQHAGVIIGLGGVAGHNFRHEPGHSRGYDDRLGLCQELSCVTAACLVTKKSVYQKVGGLDDLNLRIAFNDVDFCLKVRELGLKVIWTPFAELYHLESASRGSDLSKENIHRWNAEYTFMRGKWKHVLEADPFYNPNLAITDEDFSLAHPPRLIHPWERYKYILVNDTISRQKTV